jgi:NADPH-dependent 2,4-dienoyl-CoA reductase/sulfur reductase-like enzyme
MTTDHRYDVLIVGAGPAGLAAAASAAALGKRVGIVDDNFAPGGQIWRGGGAPRSWLEVTKHPGVEFLAGARVVAQAGRGEIFAETGQGCVTLRFERLILAPGARELLLPFPGWTLPNVMGAGGLQALVKSGLPIAGKTVVVAGSGPLLLAVAAYLRGKEAVVRLIAEQAATGRVLRFGLGLLGTPSRLTQALRFKLSLGAARYTTGCWPVAARGNDHVTAVSLTNGRRSWEEPCDYLACGFGLVPNVELPRMLGCAVAPSGVAVDEFQETSLAGVYCVGEATGIGGLEKSLVEGKIAGLAAAGSLDESRRLFPARDRTRAFAGSLERTFALRDELRGLARPETIVCRCEDVTVAQASAHHSARAAKLHTRCGMGPCQGRICGPALAFLRDWPADSVRPPVFPARVGSLTRRDGA